MASAQGSALAAPRRSACRQCSTRAVRAAPAAAARRAPALRRQAVHASVARLCDASSEPAPAPLPAPSLRRRVALFAAAAALPAALLRPALADGGAALESATFAAGDFIFLENIYDNLKYAGVKTVEAGFVGADRVRAVRVAWDPARISFDRLLREYWKNCQPARSDGQFEAKGAANVSALWVTTAAQRATAEQQRALLSQSGMFGGPVVTAITDGPADVDFEAAPEEQRGFGRREPKALEDRRKKSGRTAYLDPIWGLSTFCKDRVCGYVRFAKGCTAECLDVYTEYRDQPAAAPGFTGGDPGGGGGGPPEKADVVALVGRDPEFSFFAEALQKAQLADRLARGSNWTVFAPSDLAFAATLDALGLSKASLLASKELLSALVRLHIAPGRVPSGALRPGASVESLEGSRLRVQRAPSAASGVSVAGADVLRADIAADNGLIHVVGTVILPEDLAVKRYARTLPGVVPSVGYFDPLGFTDGQSLNEVKRLREAEVTHARVAMAAAAGIVVQEALHPLFPDVVGPAIIHFQQIPAPFWQAVAVGIGAIEYVRARKGWVEPWRGGMSLFRLHEEYKPGDLGFDPLGMQRTYVTGFKGARARELAYGRVAMLAVVTFVLQEVITAAPVLQLTRDWLN